jgi:hypothetical protein
LPGSVGFSAEQAFTTKKRWMENDEDGSVFSIISDIIFCIG